MQAIEFKTEIKKDIIKIPEKYKGIRSKHARVIILTSEDSLSLRENDSFSLPKVFLKPIEVKKYSTFDRNEIYEN